MAHRNRCAVKLLAFVTLCSSLAWTQEVTYHNALRALPNVKNAMSGRFPVNKLAEEILSPQLFMKLYMEFLKNGVNEFLNSGGSASQLCLDHLNATLRALTEKEEWALKMLDADAKVPTGLLQANLHWSGNFDECLNSTATVIVRGERNKTTVTHPFEGHYCKVGIPLGPKMKVAVDIDMNDIPPNDLSLGLCMPSTCNEEDVMSIINGVLGLIPNGTLPMNLTSDVVRCQARSVPWTTAATASVVFFSILLFIIIVATIFDLFVVHRYHVTKETEQAAQEEKSPLLVDSPDDDTRNIAFRGYGGTNESNVNSTKNIQESSEMGLCAKLLVSFSLYTNGSKLLSTRQAPGTLGCLNGIRFISMSWVILGHTYTFGLFRSTNLLPFITDHIQRFSFLAISNATVSVDTFFILSGLLVSYLSLKEISRVGGVKHFRWGMYYFHRFWRLTPAYGLVMFLYIPLTRYLSNGPYWSQNGSEMPDCKYYWWTNLLYINNLMPAEKSCMAWSWYLANDMQFYVIGPLMLIPLFVSNVAGLLVCVLFLIGCWVATIVISVTENLPMSLMGAGGDQQKVGEYFQDYYVKPYCRIGPYIIGMLVGYVLYKTDCQKRLTKLQSLIGWCVAAICCLSVLYANYDTIRGVHNASKAETALYNSLHSSAWAVGVGFVIYACATGSDICFVDKFLSWGAFAPLSRLTYTAYLIHPVVMEVFFGGQHMPMYLTDLNMIFYFLAFMTMAYSVAFVLSLTLEAPFFGIEKALFRRERKL